jgi:hypothetical protein
VFLYVFSILFYLGWKQRPFEALNAVLGAPPLSHPASASCTGTVTTVTTTTPSNANAATIAIIAIDVVVVLSFSKCFKIKISKELIPLRVPAIRAL